MPTKYGGLVTAPYVGLVVQRPINGFQPRLHRLRVQCRLENPPTVNASILPFSSVLLHVVFLVICGTALEDQRTVGAPPEAATLAFAQVLPPSGIPAATACGYRDLLSRI